MHMFDVQGIEIRAARGKVFDFLRDPGNLQRSTHVFRSVEEGLARLETPAGAVEIRLGVSADAKTGTVDWRLEFPDDAEVVDGAAMTDTITLEELARKAVGGDRDALDSLAGRLQSDIYGLALRMLWNREDAEDTTQESSFAW